MWANAQRDVRAAEYRWRPLFNTAKFGWCPLLECRAVTLSRLETRWNLLGCPKRTKWSQPLAGWSSPYCEDMWRRYCVLAALLHGTPAVGISQTLRCWTEGATVPAGQPSRWSSAHILVFYLLLFSSPNLSHHRLDVCHTSTHGVALVRI